MLLQIQKCRTHENISNLCHRAVVLTHKSKKYMKQMGVKMIHKNIFHIAAVLASHTSEPIQVEMQKQTSTDIVIKYKDSKFFVASVHSTPNLLGVAPLTVEEVLSIYLQERSNYISTNPSQNTFALITEIVQQGHIQNNLSKLDYLVRECIEDELQNGPSSTEWLCSFFARFGFIVETKR